jgi:Fe2+ or Zn2+ uptake regulation protein
MTSARHKKNGPESDAADLRRSLEQAGWRLTRQRGAVYEYLCGCCRHPTAEEIFAAARPRLPGLSLGTVYKALEALVDAGLAVKICCADGPCRYECRREAHYHFLDVETQQVHDLPVPFDPHLLDKLAPHLEERLRRQGFHVTGYRLELQGHYQG